MNAISYETEIEKIDALFAELQLKQKRLALIIELDELIKGEVNE